MLWGLIHTIAFQAELLPVLAKFYLVEKHKFPKNDGRCWLQSEYKRNAKNNYIPET